MTKLKIKLVATKYVELSAEDFEKGPDEMSDEEILNAEIENSYGDVDEFIDNINSLEITGEIIKD